MSTSSRGDATPWGLWLGIGVMILVGAIARVVGRHHIPEKQVATSIDVTEPEMRPVEIDLPEPAALPLLAPSD